MKSAFTCVAIVLLAVSTLKAQETPASSPTGINNSPVDTRPDDRRPKLGGVYSSAENGLKVDSVFTNGPLHQQDVYSGDIISHIDAVAIKSESELESFLLNKNPGDEVMITCIRDGNSREIPVRLISKTELSKVSNTEGQPPQNTSRQYVGLDSRMFDTDRLILLDDRVKTLENKVQTLRLEIKQLRQEVNDR